MTHTTFPAPIVTVDAVVFTLADDRLKLLLHRRPRDPFEGSWALPGGFVHTDEDADAAAAMARILLEKTGTSGFYLEQLATFSGPRRDPRGWSISIAHIALVPSEALKLPKGEDVRLIDVDALQTLAFDHHDIVASAMARLRGKGGYSTLPASLLGETFTFTEIQKAYEAAIGAELNESSFRRKIEALDLIEDTGETKQGVNRRPAKVYRLKDGVRTFDRNIG